MSRVCQCLRLFLSSESLNYAKDEAQHGLPHVPASITRPTGRLHDSCSLLFIPRSTISLRSSPLIERYIGRIQDYAVSISLSVSVELVVVMVFPELGRLYPASDRMLKDELATPTVRWSICEVRPGQIFFQSFSRDLDHPNAPPGWRYSNTAQGIQGNRHAIVSACIVACYSRLRRRTLRPVTEVWTAECLHSLRSLVSTVS